VQFTAIISNFSAFSLCLWLQKMMVQGAQKFTKVLSLVELKVFAAIKPDFICTQYTLYNNKYITATNANVIQQLCISSKLG